MDSVIDDVNVYHARIVAGKALAESYPVDADLVVGVPIPGWLRRKDIRTVGNSVWHGIPQEQLCRKNIYQAKTESAGKQCEDQAERDRRGCKGKTYCYGR